MGIKKATVFGNPILSIRNFPAVADVDTISLYLGPPKQVEYYDYLLSLNPKRIIFNPGTENEVFMEKARNQNIEVVVGCTLVMLSIGTY